MLARAHTKPSRTDLQHGLNTLRKSVKFAGDALTSWRYKLGRILGDWRQNLIRDVGSESATSTQQLAVIDLAVKAMLLDSIDAWLLAQPSLIDKKEGVRS